MLRHTPVDISLAGNQRIELRKEVFPINKLIILSMSHRTISIPVLINADEYVRVCILTFHCVVGYAESLCILSDIAVPVCPDHIVPCADIDLIPDDKVLNGRVCSNL